MHIEDEAELAAWVRLTLSDGVGPIVGRRLLEAFGLPSHVLHAGVNAIARIAGEAAARAIVQGDHREAVDRTLDWACAQRHHVLTLADADYPQALLTTADPPLLVYCIGDPSALNASTVAIVGSRNATSQGLGHAREFARTLAQHGYAVVSGMALGIDGAAHEGALDVRGSTIAVLGTGVDVIYPSRHRALYARIAESGAIVSEQPLGMPAIAHQFPRRNRIIAGLSRAVLVVEAALHSGSLITARLAAEQGREVFAIPGSIHSPLAKGCHRLIKDGAKLVDDARDIFDELGPASNAHALPVPAHASIGDADEDTPEWLANIGFDPFTLDDLAARSNAEASAASAALLDWELDGRVQRLPGGRWQRVAHVKHSANDG